MSAICLLAVFTDLIIFAASKFALRLMDSYTGIDTDRVLPVFDAIIAAQSLETGDDSIGTQPTDKILLLAVQDAVNGGGVQ